MAGYSLLTMTTAGWAFVAVAAVLAVLDWVAVGTRRRALERCAKPAALLGLVIAAALAHPTHPGVHGWLVLALSFGVIGDLALAFETDHRAGLPVQELSRSSVAGPAGVARAAAEASVAAVEPVPGAGAPAGRLPFALGLSSFLLGHVCYAAAMLRHGTDSISIGFGLILVLLGLFAFGYRILLGAHALGGATVTFAVTAYIAALGSAVVLGVGTTSLWVAYGIVLFGASDLVLATDRFVGRRSWAPLAVSISYHLAQFLLLIGLLH